MPRQPVSASTLWGWLRHGDPDAKRHGPSSAYEVFVTVWLEPGSPPVRTSLAECLLPLTAALQGDAPDAGRAPTAARLKIRLNGVLRQDTPPDAREVLAPRAAGSASAPDEPDIS